MAFNAVLNVQARREGEHFHVWLDGTSSGSLPPTVAPTLLPRGKRKRPGQTRVRDVRSSVCMSCLMCCRLRAARVVCTRALPDMAPLPFPLPDGLLVWPVTSEFGRALGLPGRQQWVLTGSELGCCWYPSCMRYPVSGQCCARAACLLHCTARSIGVVWVSSSPALSQRDLLSRPALRPGRESAGGERRQRRRAWEGRRENGGERSGEGGGRDEREQRGQ